MNNNRSPYALVIHVEKNRILKLFHYLRGTPCITMPTRSPILYKFDKDFFRIHLITIMQGYPNLFISPSTIINLLLCLNLYDVHVKYRSAFA